MPSRPPSPPGSTPPTTATGVTVIEPSGPVCGPTRTIVPLLRSVTSALPSGRNASPQGASRWLAITAAVAPLSPSPICADGEGDGVGRLGGVPPSSGGGGPN